MSKNRTKLVKASNLMKKIISDNSLEQAKSDAEHASRHLNSENVKNKHIADQETEKTLDEGIKSLTKRSSQYREIFKEMLELQVEVVNSAKTLTQKSKDYSNQVGEAMARIDKVLVKDFESKLLLLERFVIASQAMAELEKNGSLKKIAESFK